MEVLDVVQFKLPKWDSSRRGTIVETLFVEGLPRAYIVECQRGYGVRPLLLTVQEKDILFVSWKMNDHRQE